MDPSSAPPGVDRIESLSSGELSRSVSHEDTLNLVTPRTQEAFADAIRNVSAEELAMLETPRRGSIEITSLQRVESVALQSDAPQIPKAPRDARWRDAFVLAMVAGVIGVGILVATACCSLDAHTLLAAGATALFAAVAAGPPASIGCARPADASAACAVAQLGLGLLSVVVAFKDSYDIEGERRLATTAACVGVATLAVVKARRAAKRFARARDREAVSAAVVDLARNVYARHPAIRRLAGYAAILQLVTGFVALYCCEAVLRRKPSHLRLACAGAAALATLWLGEVLRLVLVFATLGSELHWYGLRAPPTPSDDGPGDYVSEAPFYATLARTAMLGSICKAALSRARDLSLAPCARHAKAFAPSRAHVDERLWLCVESTSLRQTGLDNVLDEGDDAAPGFRDGASATAAGCALVVALWAWVAGSDPSTVAARAVATLIVAALASRLRAAPPTASVEACFYAVHESPQGAECASPMVYRRAARLAADARAASGPRGVQRGLLISPRRGPSESEDHADQYADSPERATTATTRDGLTLL